MAHLTVPRHQGQNAPKSRQPAGASRTLIGLAGIGVPNLGGIMGRVHRGFFMPKVCLWRAGEGGRNPRRAQAVRQPEPDRHPIGVGRRDTTRPEQTIMNTSIKGTLPEICPSFILRAALEKRVRRELAKQNRKLLKSRP